MENTIEKAKVKRSYSKDKNKWFNVRVNDNFIEAIEKLIEDSGITKTQLIEKLVFDEAEKLEKKKSTDQKHQ